MASTAIRRDTLSLANDQVYELVLKYPTGKQISNGSIMFTTMADQVLFLKAEDAQKIHALGLGQNEPFQITKRNGAIIAKRVYEQQPADSDLTRKTPPAAAPAPVPSAEPEHRDDTSLSGLMASSYLAAISALIIAEQYAQKKGVNFKITSGEVRSSAHCIFIQAARLQERKSWQQ